MVERSGEMVVVVGAVVIGDLRLVRRLVESGFGEVDMGFWVKVLLKACALWEMYATNNDEQQSQVK